MSMHRNVSASASQDRLDELIAARLSPGADREKIDKRIWDLFGEEWCVMFTDLSGFSRNVARFGIIHFLQTIFESERLLIPVIEENDGILLKIEGDSFLVIFRNPGQGPSGGRDHAAYPIRIQPRQGGRGQGPALRRPGFRQGAEDRRHGRFRS